MGVEWGSSDKEPIEARIYSSKEFYEKFNIYPKINWFLKIIFIFSESHRPVDFGILIFQKSRDRFI